MKSASTFADDIFHTSATISDIATHEPRDKVSNLTTLRPQRHSREGDVSDSPIILETSFSANVFSTNLRLKHTNVKLNRPAISSSSSSPRTWYVPACLHISPEKTRIFQVIGS